MANTANVTPEIIEWARNLGNLTHSDLANQVGVHENQIIKWERGKTKPTFGQAQDLAKALHIPFGYLFLSKKPDLELPLPDLRTLRDKKPSKLSAAFFEVLYGVLDRRDWYREYIEEYKTRKLPFVGQYKRTDSPTDVAASIRNTLGITQDMRQTVATWSAYLELLSAQAEASGILVMRSSVVGNDNLRSLSVDEFQGFVVTDEIAPIVFINSADYVSARIFTLIHELAHIWIGESGVLNSDEANFSNEPQQTIETFCNAVAAETLVPKSEFLIEWEKHSGSIQNLAIHFRVSGIVIARRAYELERIDRDHFFAVVEDQKKRRKRQPKGGRSNYYENVGRRHSFVFMDSVVKDVRSGGTFFRDGARLLDMRLPTFTRMVESGEF